MLVTGGAGFIGHHLVSELLRRGHQVIAVDNFSSGRRDRLDGMDGDLEIIEADVRDRAALEAAMAGVEVVFHEAALVSVQRSIEDPASTNDVNVGGTIQVMEAAARNAVRRVVFAGSASVYGDNPALPLKETETPRPQSPYAVSKLAGEQYLHTLGALRGVETVALRYFNVYGPGQDPGSPYAAVIPKFICAALTGRQIVVNGDGHHTRDFVFVDDVVEANLLASRSDVGGRSFNIGSGQRHSLLELIRAIEDSVGRHLDTTFGAVLASDIKDSQADIAQAREQLAFVPSVDFVTGVSTTVAAATESGWHRWA